MVDCFELMYEHLNQSNAPYHNLEHTTLVTQAGIDILVGWQEQHAHLGFNDWLHAYAALLFHDIGYVRGACWGDQGDKAQIARGTYVEIPSEATDAALANWHVDRSQLFVRQQFGGHPRLDEERLVRLIEATRFPCPDPIPHPGSLAGLIRAADFIGQLADPDYLEKCGDLFYEMQENGIAANFGYSGPEDLRNRVPRFFQTAVRPFLQPAFNGLAATPRGREWLRALQRNMQPEADTSDAGLRAFVQPLATAAV